MLLKVDSLFPETFDSEWLGLLRILIDPWVYRRWDRRWFHGEVLQVVHGVPHRGITHFSFIWIIHEVLVLLIDNVFERLLYLGVLRRGDGYVLRLQGVV